MNKHNKIMNPLVSSSAMAGRRLTPRGILAGVVAVVFCGLLLAPVALAAGPPVFLPKNLGLQVFSTRVMIEARSGLDRGGLELEWKAEYSESSSGPWTEVNKETRPAPHVGDQNPTLGIYIGSGDPESYQIGNSVLPHWLRHLAPGRQYYARFSAKNADGEAEEVVPFKTLPIGRPEVDKTSPGVFTNNESPRFAGGAADATTAAFRATIEGNGAETKYSFEYAPAEGGGGRPAEGSASWKAFTSGATGAVTVA
jgi:hypothetical protein